MYTCTRVRAAAELGKETCRSQLTAGRPYLLILALDTWRLSVLYYLSWRLLHYSNKAAKRALNRRV